MRLKSLKQVVGFKRKLSDSISSTELSSKDKEEFREFVENSMVEHDDVEGWIVMRVSSWRK